MKDVSAFAIFCEDVRNEAGSRHTIIGSFPDTIEVPSFPGALRRLVVYAKIRFAVHGTFDEPVSIALEIDGAEIPHETWPPVGQDLIARSLAKSELRGMPYATITARMEIDGPVALEGPCRIRAMLNVGDESELCGILNICLKGSANMVPAGASQTPSADLPTGV